MKVLAKQNRELIMINAQNTQNENDAEKIILQVPEQYENFNKKIVFVTPDGNVWDIITNNEYLIKKAITKYQQVDFYIWLTQEEVDFRSQTKTLKFYHNVDASEEITDEEIGRVNTVINLLEEEITKVENLETEIDGKLEEIDTAIDNINTAIQETENLNLDAEKVNNTTTVTITKKDGTTKEVEINDGQDGQDYVITQQDYQEIANIVEQQVEIPSKTSDLINDNGFIDNSVNNLINYTLTTQTGSKIELEINSSNYQLTAKLKDKNNTLISTSNVIDLPIESMVVNASYSNGILTLTLQNGNTLDVDISDIVSGLVKPSDLVDYVKNTDYAGSNAGVIKTNTQYMATSTTSSGTLQADTRTYAQYQSAGNNMFIGKGTLENVITGKDLTTKAYVDGLVGDIESILHTLNTGSGV